MDKELLSAIGQLIDEKLKPLQQDISEMRLDINDLKQDMTEVKQDINGLKQDMTEVKQDIVGLKQNMTEVKQDIVGLKQEVVKTNIMIEHQVMPRLNALAEGYDFNHEETAALKKRVNRLEERVS